MQRAALSYISLCHPEIIVILTTEGRKDLGNIAQLKVNVIEIFHYTSFRSE